MRNSEEALQMDITRAAERAVMLVASGAARTIADARAASTPQETLRGFYNEDNEYISYQRAGQVIGSGPLAP